MRIETQCRTVILQLYSMPSQEKRLLKAEKQVLRFLELSRHELQKLIYHKFNQHVEPRMLTLLTQRLTGSLGNKGILCFVLIKATRNLSKIMESDSLRLN
ncbi:MAG: hypothetical protein ABGF52_02990 [Candidatus Asgardarchaeum sp.]